MIKLFLLLAVLVKNPADVLNFKPKHLMQSDELSCGASDRFLKEKVKVVLGTRTVYVNNMEWDLIGTDDDGNWVALYQVRPDQFTYLTLKFTSNDAYLTLRSIDYKRRPCEDTVYLVRSR